MTTGGSNRGGLSPYHHLAYKGLSPSSHQPPRGQPEDSSAPSKAAVVSDWDKRPVHLPQSVAFQVVALDGVLLVLANLGVCAVGTEGRGASTRDLHGRRLMQVGRILLMDELALASRGMNAGR